MTLTRRGRIVRNTAVTVAFIAATLLISYATTPDECRVPTEEMSRFCLDLMYP